jgi:hypothetical protein
MSSRNRIKSFVQKVPNKTVKQEPNYMNEFNSAIEAIQKFLSNQNDLDTLKNLYNQHLMGLIENEYFKMMYTTNYYVKKYMLNMIEILVDIDEFQIPCLLIELSESMISWDINLKKLMIHNDKIELYQPFLKKLLPFIIIYASSKEIIDIKPDVLVHLSECYNIHQDSNYSDSNMEPKLFNLIRLICYLFINVSYETLLEANFFPEMIGFLFNYLMFPNLNSEVSFLRIIMMI